MSSLQTLSRSAATTTRRPAARSSGAVKVHAIKSQTPYRDELIATVRETEGVKLEKGAAAPAVHCRCRSAEWLGGVKA